MDIGDFLRPDRVITDLRAGDKARLTTELSRRAAAALQRAAQPVEAALVARERLGSTGLGRGFALPHARLDGLPRFFGLFARLARPIDFEAIDGHPVDLVFLLLIPSDASGEHVSALAAISRRMRDPAVVQQIRAAPDPARLYTLLAGTNA